MCLYFSISGWGMYLRNHLYWRSRLVTITRTSHIHTTRKRRTSVPSKGPYLVSPEYRRSRGMSVGYLLSRSDYLCVRGGMSYRGRYHLSSRPLEPSRREDSGRERGEEENPRWSLRRICRALPPSQPLSPLVWWKDEESLNEVDKFWTLNVI